MFCPNCGTENEDSATTCKKCGFNLKGAAAPKFKGTMLMMNAPPGVPRPGASGTAPVPSAVPSKLKGTMLGVAPPSMGSSTPGDVPPPPAPPAPAFPAAGQGPGAPGAPPGHSPGQQQPGQAHPGQGAGVNPLGGTMVADPSAMAANPYGPPPGGSPQGGGASPYGPPPGGPAAGGPQPGFGAPPGGGMPGGPQAGGPQPGGPQPGGPQPGGYGGGPPGGQPGYGPPGEQPGGYGAPAQPGYGQPPGQGYGPPAGHAQAGHQHPGQPQAYGQQPGYGAPQALDAAPNYGGMAQPGPYGMPGGAPIMRAPSGPHGPVGNIRNPVTVTLLTYVCFIYGFIVLWSTLNELRAFRNKDDLNPIMFFVPILNLIELWKLPEKVLDAKHMAGVPNPQVPHPVLYLLLWPYFLTADLNEVFQAAGARPA